MCVGNNDRCSLRITRGESSLRSIKASNCANPKPSKAVPDSVTPSEGLGPPTADQPVHYHGDGIRAVR